MANPLTHLHLRLMPAQPTARFWMGTIPMDDWTPPTLLPAGISWMRGQAELAASGYRHWQLCLRTTLALRLSGVKPLLVPTAHLEATRSAASSAYVWKEDTRIAGTQFQLGELKSPGPQIDWDAVRASARTGAFEEIPSSVMMRYTSNILRVHALYATPMDRDFAFARVFVGPTGVGKSHRAMAEARAAEGGVYIKSSTTKWWDGYRGELNVVIDEFDGQVGIVHLLRWLDKWACSVEIKGGTTPLCAVRFWITSNLPVDTWFLDGARTTQLQRDALARRLTVTEITERAE